MPLLLETSGQDESGQLGQDESASGSPCSISGRCLVKNIIGTLRMSYPADHVLSWRLKGGSKVITCWHSQQLLPISGENGRKTPDVGCHLAALNGILRS